MCKMKRWLALLLVAMMLTATLPVTALAEETSSPDTESVVQTAPKESEEEGDSEDNLPETPDTQKTPETPAAPEISTYEITELGVWVGEEYVPAVEEDITHFSLLPLEEREFSLDLTGYLPEELREVKIAAVLKNMTGDAQEGAVRDDVAVWAKWSYYDENGDYVYKEDNYQLVDRTDTVDLSDFSLYGSQDRDTFYLELIVGSADQFDSSNLRYIVNVTVSACPLQFAAKDGVKVLRQYQNRTGNGAFNQYQLTIDPTTWDGKAPFALTASLKDDFDLPVRFYEGFHETVGEAEGSVDITGQIYGSSASGYSKDYSQKETDTMPAVTAVFQRDGKNIVRPFYLYAYQASDSISVKGLYQPSEYGNYYQSVVRDVSYGQDEETDAQMKIFEMQTSSLPADATYYAQAAFFHYNESVSDVSQYLKHTAAGYYATAAAAETEPDITGQLFSDTGYPANYSGKGQIFTAVLQDGSLRHFGAAAKDRVDTPSGQTYFSIRGAYKQPGSDRYANYIVKSEDDSYAAHYQTAFLMNRGTSYDAPMSPVTETAIYPVFDSHMKARVVASADGKDLGGQHSGESQAPFVSGTVVQYTAYAEDDAASDNYFVTFLTQQHGAKLFVNAQNCLDAETGEPYREIHLDAPDTYHDILFANIGDEELTGLYVKLESLDTLQLDPYWTIGPDSTGKLVPFTTTDSETPDGDYVSYGELSNLAKIRLRPKLDEDGQPLAGLVNGTLTIGSANGGEVKIRLSGTTGKLAITNADLVDGVKYVPYSSGIRTNCIDANNNLEFSLVEGVLPSPLTVNPDTGEIYGVPLSAGEFTFTVQVKYKNLPENLSAESLKRMSATAEFTLTILENTDDNVWNATDEMYTVTNPIGIQISGNHYVWSTDSNDTLFVSDGDFAYFLALYLDGQKLKTGLDYSAESGSTVITLRSRTLSSKGDGTHTLAMEFREGDPVNGTLKRAAQNYEVKINRPSIPDHPGPDSSGGSSSDGGSSSNNSKPKPDTSKPDTSKPGQPSEPTSPDQPIPPSTGLPFTDVPANSWFLEDVKWISEQALMNGTSAASFSPGEPISQATIVTVLARLAKVDLKRFEAFADAAIEPGKWYTTAAIWAKQSGLLPDHTDFTGEATISRDQMAIMLVKYLRSMGKDTTPPAQPVAFADAALMSADGNDAFQILYQHNIFKGVGESRMDPEGFTTRAQFAALVHRISDLITP